MHRSPFCLRLFSGGLGAGGAENGFVVGQDLGDFRAGSSALGIVTYYLLRQKYVTS